MNESDIKLPSIEPSVLTNSLNTAVLFLVFNRPDTTELVFDVIRAAKPPKLYIAADGPRTDKSGEAENVELVRSIVTNVDWECEVKTLFRNENLGCKNAVSGAINWFFENEDMGIILEDDCLPDVTFFRFCEELLEYYQYDQRIGMISGNNFQSGKSINNHSYYFSKFSHIWGWATWRDRWINTYDVDMKKWPYIRNNNYLNNIVSYKKEADFWSNVFEFVYCGKVDTWDYQWAFANLIEGRLNIMPKVNMITNIGFNENATHTVIDSDIANMERNSINFPINHPIGIFRSYSADKSTYDKYFRVTLFRRIREKILSWSCRLFKIK